MAAVARVRAAGCGVRAAAATAAASDGRRWLMRADPARQCPNCRVLVQDEGDEPRCSS